jgi:hypothetical protein
LEQLTAFDEQLRTYLLRLWVVEFRTIEVAPVLFSENGVQPIVVSVRLVFTTDARVLVKRPEAPARPKRPQRMLNSFLGLGGEPNIDYTSLIPRAEPINMRAPEVSQTGSSALVKYSLLRIAQDAATTLDPFFIEFGDETEPPDCMRPEYEIRAQNMNTVLRNHLLVKIEQTEKAVPASFLLH